MSDAATGNEAPSARKAINPWLIAPMVALAAFMEVLDISIANVSLSNIAGSLGAGPEESTWVLTSYLVTNAIALPIAGWLSEYFGRTRFFIACIIGFSAASLACGLAPSLGMLIFFRAIQGLAGGALQPVSQAILADAFPPAQRAMAFAMYGIAVVAAPAIGPTLGGWITDQFSWHWIFLINVPVGALLIVLIRMYLPDEKPNHDGSPIDYVGFGLIAVGIGSLQWLLDRGQNEDWWDSLEIQVLTGVVIVALLTYIVRSFDQDNPIVNLRLYRYRNYAISNLLMFVLGFILLGSTALLPLFMESLLGYTALDAGLVISPGGFAIMAMMPVVGKLAGKVDLRLMISFGLLCAGSSLWFMGGFTLQVDSTTLALMRVWQTLGIAFLFIPINTMAYIGLPASANNQAASMLAFMRNLGGGVGISVLVTLISRLGAHHRVPLVANTSPGDPEWEQHLSQLQGVTGSHEQALALLNQTVQGQAQMLAYIDAFHFMGALFVLMIPLVLLLKPGQADPDAEPAPAH
ncbi:DHA2 family efflux MFS transporter permease subunit [Marinobacter mangrovi]|uniref:DHA2 family efflux MFS transporter permease subunit n=1 Tax=Marinobacter mangrovi TaxID=2803918 RepID=UPI0019336DF1|nr:DHA2 family efflux MFS transporter permease subunit [Marinobacter mangrovi]